MKNNNMRIGILTFHSAHNYGALYQAYGLKMYLKQHGYKVEILDYRPYYIENKYALFPKGLKGLKDTLKEIIKIPSKFIRRNRFKSFISKYIQPFPDKQEWSQFDVYIVGSDQVWSPFITAFDPYYWGTFERKQNSRLISYAPSFEIPDLQDEDLDKMVSLINRFDRVSLREQSSIDLLSDKLKRSPELVIDPTLLVDRNTWLSFVKKQDRKEKYILVYQVRVSNKVIECAKGIAHKNKLKIKVVVSNRYNNPFSEVEYIKPSPIEFLNLVYNAELIMSSSFHGVAMSIVYHKPFYAFTLCDGRNDRIMTLLDNTGLSNRMIDKESDISLKPIRYGDVEKMLYAFREKSEKYLITAINDKD